jgi:uncharacterized membrane protein YesL
VASRAENPIQLTPTAASDRPSAPPSIGGALRAAAQDGYYHSWRLVPANVVWSVVALSIAGLALIAPPAILLFPLLALPTAGIFRVTTRIVRGEAVSFWDAIDAWRTNALATIGIGAGFVAATIVLGFNVVSGLASASLLGWGLATLAAWGLLATWLLAWTAWPILVDPRRADRPIMARLRLAALLVLAHPIRIALLGIVLGLFLAVSTLAVVALATVSVAFSALVASRFILPAADRLEARLASDDSREPSATGVADNP